MRLVEDGAGSKRSFDIDLDSKPLGEGGAGKVYAHPLDRFQVVKIYKPDQVDAHADKIRAMLANPPEKQRHQHNGCDVVQIAWPKARVTDAQGNFQGFTMSMVDFSASTEVGLLMQRSDRQAEGLREDYEFRLYAARNLASLVTELHKHSHFFIDMKPQNMRVYRDNGFIALIDCDGFSVFSATKQRFPAKLVTPDYLCPDGFGQSPSDLNEDQDRFALGVIIFQLLNNGVHPFQGSIKPGHDADVPSEISSRIKKRQYAHARSGKGPQGPHPRALLSWLESSTADLFERAFTSDQNRPTAKEWVDHLYSLLSNIKKCSVSPHHQHFSKGCGLCAQDAQRKQQQAAVHQVPAPPNPAKPSLSPRSPTGHGSIGGAQIRSGGNVPKRVRSSLIPFTGAAIGALLASPYATKLTSSYYQCWQGGSENYGLKCLFGMDAHPLIQVVANLIAFIPLALGGWIVTFVGVILLGGIVGYWAARLTSSAVANYTFASWLRGNTKMLAGVVGTIIMAFLLYVNWPDSEREIVRVPERKNTAPVVLEGFSKAMDMAQQEVRNNNFEKAEAYYARAYEISQNLDENYKKNVLERRASNYTMLVIEPKRSASYTVKGSEWTRLGPIGHCGHFFKPMDHARIFASKNDITVMAESKVLSIRNGVRISEYYPTGKELCIEKSGKPTLYFRTSGNTKARVYISK